MKYYYPVIAIFLLIGCAKKKGTIEFAGKTPGIKTGVFVIRTVKDSTVYGDNIRGEKFSITKQLEKPGYYQLDITDADNPDKHLPFEVYLENGKYTIETEPGKLYKYPKITSPSKIQEQLSSFYTISDQLSAENQKTVTELNNKLKSKEKLLTTREYVALINTKTDAENKVAQSNIIAFKQFVKQYPNSGISAHLMSKLNYDDDAATYNTIFKTLSPEAKNSEEGLEIGKRLEHLVKLVPGAKAPVIEGKMPDGKAFSPASLTKKYVLLEFWKAGNDMATLNHEKIKMLLTQTTPKKDLEIISVSLDKDPAWWAAGIRNDKLKWTQIADLKGNESPNAVNWSITRLPMYYLLDKDWHILMRDVNLGTLDSDVGDYIRLHP
jgi:hypothetical protein